MQESFVLFCFSRAHTQVTIFVRGFLCTLCSHPTVVSDLNFSSMFSMHFVVKSLETFFQRVLFSEISLNLAISFFTVW